MKKAYDLKSIKELSEDDPEFVKAIVATFIEEIPRDLDHLEEALAHNNRALVHEYAHKMKPTVEMFGLDCHYDVLVLEAWGRSEDQMDVNDHLTRVRENVNMAVAQLKADF